MERMPYQVGIVGYGSSARIYHIPFIHASPYFHLYSVVQRQVRPGQANAVTELPGVKVFDSLDDMIQDENVHLVIITTPPGSHLELATAALKVNKHVVVEKPFTTTFAEAEALISLARERSLLLTGTLGRIVEVESHFDRFRPNLATNTWKAHPGPGNGAIYDLGTHLIDQIVHLFGVPARVTGFIGSKRTAAINATGLEDSFTVLLHFEDGMLATIKAGVISPEIQQLLFWVRGDGASFRTYGLDPQEAQLKRGVQPNSDGFGVEEGMDNYGVLTVVGSEDQSLGSKDVRLSSVVEQGNGTYSEFYSRLASALKNGEPGQLPVAADQAAQVIRLVQLAQESSKLGKTMIV
ncbi:hypothetical protein V1525DRAFT_440358 [Lipomyces kononenkoae]|uniref:Uncharacterized protein n=1 Tax=Lipomyces kononenkoae TaxID=34357 RepID=A0ACC3SQL5_LIPKO